MNGTNSLRRVGLLSTVLATLWMVGSCTQSLGPEGEASVSELAVFPSVATLLPSADTQFVAVGMTAVGDTGSVMPEWSAAGGSIDANGRYTAPATAGQYEVMAVLGSLADTAAITVSSATLSRIEVIPTSVSVAPGASVTFQAVGIDSNSDTVPVSVFWSASGGTIDQTGNWTAPAATGTYDIQASNGQFTDSATGVVSSGQPPPPPPGSRGPGANEPAGMTALGEHEMNCLPNSVGNPALPECLGLLNGQWNTPHNHLSQVETPANYAGVVRHIWPNGDTKGSGNGYAIDLKLSGVSEVYVRFFINVRGQPLGGGSFSNDFPGGGNETKFFYLNRSSPDIGNWWIGIQGDQTPLATTARFGVGWKDGDRTIPPEFTQNLNQSKRFEFGTWEEMEVVLSLGSLNGRDGEFHVWLDGVKVMQQTGLHLRGNTLPGDLYQFHWAPIPGTDHNRDDVADIDHIYVSVR